MATYRQALRFPDRLPPPESGTHPVTFTIEIDYRWGLGRLTGPRQAWGDFTPDVVDTVTVEYAMD